MDGSFLILGKEEVGKTTFCNVVLNRSSSIPTQTNLTTEYSYKIGGKNFTLVDTPGILNDIEMSEHLRRHEVKLVIIIFKADLVFNVEYYTKIYNFFLSCKKTPQIWTIINVFEGITTEIATRFASHIERQFGHCVSCLNFKKNADIPIIDIHFNFYAHIGFIKIEGRYIDSYIEKLVDASDKIFEKEILNDVYPKLFACISFMEKKEMHTITRYFSDEKGSLNTKSIFAGVASAGIVVGVVVSLWIPPVAPAVIVAINTVGMSSVLGGGVLGSMAWAAGGLGAGALATGTVQILVNKTDIKKRLKQYYINGCAANWK